MGVYTPEISPGIRQLAAEQTLQLSPLEVTHVHAVLQATLEKLALVGTINVDPRVQAQELTQNVGEDITRMISEQKALELRFEQLIAAQPALRNMPNKAKLRENQEELARVSGSLRQATKQLCRNLKDSPNVSANLEKVACERQALQLLLANVLEELHEKQTVEAVVAWGLAAEHAQVEMHETIEAERAATCAVKQLRADLREEKAAHEEKMRESRKAQMSLRDELRVEQLQTAVDARFHAKDVAATNQRCSRLEQARMAEITHELAQLRQQIEIERSVAAATAGFLAKDAARMHDKSAAWQAKHDEDVRVKERELEALRSMHASELHQLKDLENRFRDELMLKHDREAKERETAEAAEEEARLQERRLQATLTIQAAWRGFKARSGLKGSSKKSSKGKGKAAGKAGKKGSK